MRRVYGGPCDGRIVRWRGLSSKCSTGWMRWGLYRTVDDPRAVTGWHICSGPEGGDDAAWEDGGEPDPEAESTYSTQPTDLWRNHTTE